MAVSQVGAVSQIVPRLMIEGKGADQSKVQWVSVGASAARLQSVIAKRVDGAPMNSVFAVRALKYDYLHVIGDALKDLPYFMYTWDVCSAEAAQKKRAQYVAFVAATAKGCRWAMDNQDEAGAISRKVLPDLPVGEAEYAAADFAKKKFWSPTGMLDPQGLGFHGRRAGQARQHQGKDEVRRARAGRCGRRRRKEEVRLQSTMSEQLTLEQVEALVTRAPYHQWLGLKVIAVHDDGIEIKATWREEWVVNLERRFTHGGILASLVDLGADWAMVRKLGRGVPTIDMRVDYHAVALPGDLTIKGKVVRMGSQFSVSEASIFSADGKLLASGRGTYYTAPPPPPKA